MIGETARVFFFFFFFPIPFFFFFWKTNYLMPINHQSDHGQAISSFAGSRAHSSRVKIKTYRYYWDISTHSKSNSDSDFQRQKRTRTDRKFLLFVCFVSFRFRRDGEKWTQNQQIYQYQVPTRYLLLISTEIYLWIYFNRKMRTSVDHYLTSKPEYHRSI